jgi:hypothetical protein
MCSLLVQTGSGAHELGIEAGAGPVVTRDATAPVAKQA